jgi:riboflavin kinase/FMN adenylyltransferase
MTDPATRSADSGLPPNVTGTVATVGTFDGVHRGHRDVLLRLVERSAASGLPSLVVSFSPHPLQVVNPAAAPPLLTTEEEKLELLALCGVNYLLVLPFTAELSQYSAEDFVGEILIQRARMRELLIGYDHGFGRGRAGDAETLQMIGARRGFSVQVVPPVLGADKRAISSTSIRTAIAAADLAGAADGLGRLYSADGIVERGAGRGHALGYPTINIALPAASKLLPPHGVYAVRVQTPLGTFGGMLSLGPRPTFSEGDVTFEANLFDVSADFYDSRVKVEFVTRLRDIVRYNSADELRSQIGRDEEESRRALTPWLQTNNINSYTRNRP